MFLRPPRPPLTLEDCPNDHNSQLGNGGNMEMKRGHDFCGYLEWSDTVKSLLTTTLVSDQLYLRPPWSNPN